MIRKKRLVLIIILCMIILALAISVTVIILSTNLFKSDRELFWKYFVQNIDIAEILFDDKVKEQYEFKQNNSYVSNGNLSLVIKQGENSSKQLNAITNSRHDKITGRRYSDAILKNGDIDLFKVSYINSGDIYGIKCDEIFPNYIGLQNSNIRNFALDYGVTNNSDIPNKIVPENIKDLFKINEEQKRHIQELYFPIINNKIKEEQFKEENENIQINETVINTNVYTLVLTSENIKEILRDVLANVKLDNQTMDMFTQKFALLEMGEDYTDINKLQTKIDNLLKIIEDMEIENDLKIKIYQNGENTIRIVLKIEKQFSVIYEKIENTKKIEIEMPSIDNLNKTTVQMQNEENSNEIIDLSQEEGKQADKGNTKIIINKQEEENVVKTNIKILPDINNEIMNMNINICMEKVQNGTFNNTYSINGELFNKNTELTYSISTIQKENVDEIEELNGNNTAIANYYKPEEYIYFLESWVNLFKNRFMEKMSMLGFYEQAR